MDNYVINIARNIYNHTTGKYTGASAHYFRIVKECESVQDIKDLVDDLQERFPRKEFEITVERHPKMFYSYGADEFMMKTFA